MSGVVERREPATLGAPGGTVPRLFGTDGIRMVVGAEWTPAMVADVGSALAGYLQGSGDVAMARDYRTSSEAMSRLLSGAFLMHGINVRDLGVMPTPCLQFNVKALHANLGVTITASHNPNEFNGVKVTGPDGLEIPRPAEEVVERAIAERKFVPGAWDRIGTLRSDGDGVDRYVTSILHHVDRRAVQARSPLVVLDCGNGTSAATSPQLLRELGCRVITLNANPDGHFTGRPSEPTEENLWALRRAVADLGADLGVAHDGDSDRVAFVDDAGKYVPGEVTLALFARHRLREHPGGTVATSVTSSTCVEDVVREEKGQIVITRSGSLPVARAVTTSNAVFGGEENGGYYWPEHQVARDGPMSSAKMIELLVHTGRPLSALVSELPKYYLSKTKVPLARHLREWVVARTREVLATEAERLLTLDGTKAFFPGGWLLIRPSGTEPICRIFGEGKAPEEARRLMERGVELVRGLVAERETPATLPA